MSDVNATGEAKIVHRSKAATPCMTMTAFLGSLLPDTREIQPEKGRTPSRATAQIRRDEATPATVVFFRFVCQLMIINYIGQDS